MNAFIRANFFFNHTHIVLQLKHFRFGFVTHNRKLFFGMQFILLSLDFFFFWSEWNYFLKLLKFLFDALKLIVRHCIWTESMNIFVLAIQYCVSEMYRPKCFEKKSTRAMRALGSTTEHKLTTTHWMEYILYDHTESNVALHGCKQNETHGINHCWKRTAKPHGRELGEALLTMHESRRAERASGIAHWWAATLEERCEDEKAPRSGKGTESEREWALNAGDTCP